MKNYEKVLAEAIRIEHDQQTDDLFIVFKILDPMFKQNVKKNWIEEIEYKIVNKFLMEKE